MRRYATLTALAIALGIAIGPQVFAQSAGEKIGDAVDRTADRVGDAMNRTGDVLAPDAEAIRDVLAQIAEASVTKDGLDDLVERFVDADRNRIGAAGSLTQDNDHLNGIIEQFNKNWKAKYNQEFDIKDEDAVFNADFVRIIQGEIGEARTAGERTGAPNTTPGPEADRVAGGDTNREPGRNVATVVIAESHGLPMTNVPFIHEMPDSWRADVSDTVTAQKLRKNLSDTLTKCNDKYSEWPSDVNEAYRGFTHKILIAVTDQKMMDKAKDDMMPDRSTPPPQPR
jgi:hypothetical protein